MASIKGCSLPVCCGGPAFSHCGCDFFVETLSIPCITISFSWVGMSLAARRSRKIPQIREKIFLFYRSPCLRLIALNPCCPVMTFPPVSPSKDGNVSPLKDAGWYGSVSWFLSVVMSLYLGVCFSRLIGQRPIRWNRQILGRYTDRTALLLFKEAESVQFVMVSVFPELSWAVSFLSFPWISFPTSCPKFVFQSDASSSVMRSCAGTIATCSVSPHR